MTLWAFAVALRKESVDRNLPLLRTIQRDRSVALRKESVDRNRSWARWAGLGKRSLSARRAWIEICTATESRPDGRSRSPQGERG